MLQFAALAILFSARSVVAQELNTQITVPEPTDSAPPPPSNWDIGFAGYLRVEGSSFMPDRFLGISTSENETTQRNPLVGRNDGLDISDARLNMRARYGERLYIRLAFDGAVASYADANDVVGRLSTGVRDAYMRFEFSKQLQLFGGRFKPPFDMEELTATDDQFFVQRALESRGVWRNEGFSGDMRGFAPGRQTGIMLAGDNVIDIGRVGIGYSLAVTNGNANDARLNDNDLPAVWARISASWLDDVKKRKDEEGPATNILQRGGRVGLSSFYNKTSTGSLPDRFNDRIVGMGVDAAWNTAWFYCAGQVLASRTDHESRDATKAEYALGGHVQFSVRLPWADIYPGYRFGYYNPRTVFGEQGVAATEDYDRVMHHTLGIRYRPRDFPLTFLADYTHSVEQGGRQIPNDRVEGAVQVTFQ